MIGRVDCVDGACRAERPGLVHRALVGGNIILVLAKTKRVGTDRVRQKRSVDFLTGMACLLETAADVIAVLVHSGTKACIDYADDPGPIVRDGCRSIATVAIRKHGRWKHQSLARSLFVIAARGGR